MRKTRSRHNNGLINRETSDKEKDKFEPIQPVRKRGRRSIQCDEQTSNILTGDIIDTNSKKEINENNEINEETALSSKKSSKASSKKQFSRNKNSGNSKKELSKSNFSMNKILQNTPIKYQERLEVDSITSRHDYANNDYVIRISEECFHHWKRTKEELNINDDEDLIYHLMNLKRRTLSVALESLSTEHQIINGDEKLSELNLSPVNTLKNEIEDDKVIIKSPRTRKNKRLTNICNQEAECDSIGAIDVEHKYNENTEVGKEKVNRKRRKNSRYDCRKTPFDGIPHSENVNGPIKSKTKSEDRVEITTDEIDNSDTLKSKDIERENAETPPNRPNSGLEYPMMDENWCYNCDLKHETQKDCPYEDPVSMCIDSVIDFSANDRDVNSSEANEKEGNDGYNNYSRMDLSKSFAQLSIPHLLILQERGGKKILGVVAKNSIKALTQFGPLQGEQIFLKDIADDFEMKELWQIILRDGTKKYVSTTNPEKSNWVRYIRPAPTRKQRNVAAVYKDDQLYFITSRNISKGEEILYWMDDPDLLWTKKKCEKKNCGGCNLKFSHPLYYRLHCNVFHDPHYSLTIRKYHCKICGLAVLGKENIVKHASTEHDGRGAYQCQYCKKFFLRLNYLEMHRTYGCSENPGRTRPLCDLCGKKFCQPQKLKVHMRRMHSGKSEAAQEFQCQICEKVLGTRHAALRHRKEVHSDIPIKANGEVGAPPSRVDCPKCERTFKNKSNLKIHMLTHSGVKPFGCKVAECKTRFTTKQCLQFHYRKTHNLTDENMPSIEREIPYTLSAYSGGIADEVKPNKRKRAANDLYPGKKDVYDFKESDDDAIDKRRKMLEKEEFDTRRSITSDPDEGKSGSDINLDDKAKANEDDYIRNGSSVDADDESDEKMSSSRRVYKSRFASRLSTSESERFNQERQTELFENASETSKTKKMSSLKTRPKYISSTRTRSSTRSKATCMEVDREEIDGYSDLHDHTGGRKVAPIDTNTISASASSLVLAALSAAEQDLGAHVSSIDTKGVNNRIPSPTRNDNSFSEKEGQLIQGEDPVSTSSFSDAHKKEQEISHNANSHSREHDSHSITDPTNSVTITPHRGSHDSLETNGYENHTSTNLHPEDFRAGNTYSSASKIGNAYEEVSKSEAMNSVEIIPVPKPIDIVPVNGSVYEDFSKKNASETAAYLKDNVNGAASYHSSDMKSPLPRQPTPSATINEGLSHNHLNSRSPSSLPPPPSTPHFPANAYPHHFPSPDLVQFSSPLYHSGLDSLARSCYPPFRPHSNSIPADYSAFPRNSSHSVDFMSQSIPASNHDGSYSGPINGMNNFANVNGTNAGISSTPSPSSLDLSQTSSSSAAAIAAAAVAEMLPPPGNPRSPFGNNSSPSHLSPFYPPAHCNMINDHLLNVATGPKDLTSPRVPSSHMHNVPDSSAARQGANPYINQNYSLYESSRFSGNASSMGYPTPPTPPNGHNRLPHISPGASPYHNYGYFQ